MHPSRGKLFVIGKTRIISGGPRRHRHPVKTPEVAHPSLQAPNPHASCGTIRAARPPSYGPSSSVGSRRRAARCCWSRRTMVVKAVTRAMRLVTRSAARAHRCTLAQQVRTRTRGHRRRGVRTPLAQSRYLRKHRLAVAPGAQAGMHAIFRHASVRPTDAPIPPPPTFTV